MKMLIDKVILSSDTVLRIPVTKRGPQLFVCHQGTAYELARFNSEDVTMLPVIRGGLAYVTIENPPDFGTVVSVLHVYRAKGKHPRAGRWQAAFIRSSSWLFESELNMSTEEINSSVAAWYDDNEPSFCNGVGL